jgi:putative oxidoreductase
MHSMLLALGRLLLGALFLISGVRKVLAWPGPLDYMQSKGFPAMDIAGYPLVQIVLVAVIALEIIGALMLITGLGARPAAFALAVFTIAAAAIFHDFWTMTDAAQYTNQLNHFLKNVAIAGGLLAVAGQPKPDERTSV